MDRIARQNEQTKLLATAVNNIGVAVIVTGGVGPVVAYMLDTLPVADPLRLLAFVVICLLLGGALLLSARAILKGLV